MPKAVDLTRLASSTITCRHLPLGEALSTLVDAGIGIVEIAAFPAFAPHFDLFGATPAEEDRLVSVVSSFPVRVCSLNTSIGAFNDPATDEPAMLQAAGRVIRVAARVGARAISVSGGSAIDRQSQSLSDHIGAHGRGLRRIAQMAKDAGLRMSIEAPHGGGLVRTAAEALSLLAAIDHPNAFLIFDSAHHHRAGWTMDAAVAALGDRIDHVHLRDRVEPDNAYPLGAGQIDFARLFRALDEVGYQGVYSFELPEAGKTSAQVALTLKESLAHLRSLAW